MLQGASLSPTHRLGSLVRVSRSQVKPEQTVLCTGQAKQMGGNKHNICGQPTPCMKDEKRQTSLRIHTNGYIRYMYTGMRSLLQH